MVIAAISDGGVAMLVTRPGWSAARRWIAYPLAAPIDYTRWCYLIFMTAPIEHNLWLFL
jgi:hypothetical protein